jgi:hypothetical protein
MQFPIANPKPCRQAKQPAGPSCAQFGGIIKQFPLINEKPFEHAEQAPLLNEIQFATVI